MIMNLVDHYGLLTMIMAPLMAVFTAVVIWFSELLDEGNEKRFTIISTTWIIIMIIFAIARTWRL